MISIAIDGPAGAGKSTIAKMVAKQKNFIYIDTGALYRSIGYFVISNGGDLENKEEIISLLEKIDVEIKFLNEQQHVFVNGIDVNDKIRTEEVSMAASKVSAIAEVRKFLFDLQQNFAKEYNVVMDGRDIGTVVLPNAQVKIFLTASAEVRATRRYNEQKEKGLNVEFNSILEDIKKRDFQDENRAIAPLKPAKDSVYMDSSEMDADDVANKIIEICDLKISKGE